MIPRGAIAVFSALVSAAFIVGSMFRSDIAAYLTNDIGAPIETAQARVISSDEPAWVRLAVAGDVGTGGAEVYRTAEVMDTLDEQSQFHALLLLGDNVYPSGDPDHVQARVFDPFEAVLDHNTELVAALGNHDVRNGNGPAHAEALGMPNQWYATEIGNVLVITLDSNQSDDQAQLEWLRSTLTGPRPTWTIVTMHHPAYSAGKHGSDGDVRRHFVPLFEEFGVDLVLSGHDHDYQRSTPMNGITYVVSGAAAKLRPAGRDAFTAVSWSTYSFVDLVVYGDRLEGQAIDHDGRAIDNFVIQARSG